MNIKFLNLTPHGLSIAREGLEPLYVPPSGIVARVRVENHNDGYVEGVRLFASTFHQVENLPKFENGVILIVSTLVRLNVPYRCDVYSPHGVIRDTNGNPIGCSGLTGNGAV